ncbi:MAG: LysM peptidoglycan-binding domain-containing protein, partial [Bacteroidetes bacterium]|nr:LysM peptidoglycan-binding domain-containing protein [Bacteroidota bacterium]
MTHIVQKGETLLQIAKKYNTSLAKLIDENNIKNPNLISIGSTLIIPEPNQKIISHPELT